MKGYRVVVLPEPAEIRVEGQRKQEMTVAIVRGNRVLFAGSDENMADAYVRHLNKIERSMTCPS